MKLDEERNLLALARGVAGNYIKAHPTQYPHVEELVGDACQGIAEALSRHDPDKGASLASFAYQRASGAVIDGIRRRSPMSRGAFAREGNEAAQRLVPVSLEKLADEGWVPGFTCPGFADVEDQQHVEDLLRLCTPTERFVVRAVVMYGYPAVDVARHLGVTQTAVSIFKKKALDRMRRGVPARRSSVRLEQAS